MFKKILLEKIVSIGKSIIRPLAAIILSLLVASLVLFVSGHNPLDVYSTLVTGAITDFSGTLRWTIPMIISGLAVAVAFRSGIFNLGVDGQLYMGAIAATWIGLTFSSLTYPFSSDCGYFGRYAGRCPVCLHSRVAAYLMGSR